jgi:hypothetical protein
MGAVGGEASCEAVELEIKLDAGAEGVESEESSAERSAVLCSEIGISTRMFEKVRRCSMRLHTRVSGRQRERRETTATYSAAVNLPLRCESMNDGESRYALTTVLPAAD